MKGTAAVIFGTIPALTTLADEPVAMATALYAEEPPQPPELSDEEREALDAKKAGTLKPTQRDALKSAEKKQQTAEKYRGERNQQKQRGGPRRR